MDPKEFFKSLEEEMHRRKQAKFADRGREKILDAWWEAAKTQQRTSCHACGADREPHDNFCSNCGKKLTE